MILVLSHGAFAHPPPIELAEDPPIDWRRDRAFFEWSTWIRLGIGTAQEPVDAAARTTTPPEPQRHAIGEAALGADVTLPLPSGRVRLGPWIEVRTDGVFGGGELLVAGGPLHMFWFNGEHVFVARGGGNGTHVTGAIAYGYRCPWKLWGPWNKTTRYEIGVRFVASASRAIHDRDDWSMSFGLEFEPVGSLRYIAGIQSWY